MSEEQSPSGIGAQLGHYRIVSLLGAGGMGEVYLAEDPRLGRKVALKLLPKHFTGDADRVRRFQREARAASALNHPNIVTIFDIGQVESTHFLATEYIEGETLRERLSRSMLSTAEAVDLAIQTGSALSAAHDAGIVHRDLKPENIMVRRDGYVKVLDFGLAKLTEKPQDPTTSDAPTRVNSDTNPGVVLGTVAYMSPEQARGLALDSRSDIFSLGVVLYELIAGSLPFSGATSSDVISSIIGKDPPPLARYSPDLPPELQWIVSKALRKQCDDRYQTIKEMLSDLRELQEQIQLKSRMERSLSPESAGQIITTGSQETVATSQVSLRNSNEAQIRTTSSAEYLITGVKQHKLSAIIALVLIIAAAIGIVLFLRPTNTEAAVDSIAVLPFENNSNDTEAEYISDGIAESIINSLTRLPNIKVIPRSIAFRYRDRAADPQKVGEELRVSAVLTGRIVRRGDNLNVSVELDDVRHGKQLWGEQYSRKLADLLAVQSEISNEISQRLRSHLSGEDRKQLTKASTKNPEAYQLYLKGNYYTSKYTIEGFRKGVDYYKQAIALDPNYALAYDGLAYNYSNAIDWAMVPSDAGPKTKEAARKALEIDETLSNAHVSLALVAGWYDWDPATAEKEFKRAIELNPKEARAHGFYSWQLAVMGRVDQAIEEADRAVQLDPSSPENYAFRGFVFLYAHRYEQAIEQLRKGVEMDADFWMNFEYLGRSYEAAGRLAEAIETYQRALQLENGNGENWANLGHAYAVTGRKAEAQKIIDHLKDPTALSYVSHYNLAVIYAGLRDKEQALVWLERSYANRSCLLVLYIGSDPRLDSLRSDPRFQSLLKLVGVEELKN